MWAARRIFPIHAGEAGGCIRTCTYTQSEVSSPSIFAVHLFRTIDPPSALPSSLFLPPGSRSTATQTFSPFFLHFVMLLGISIPTALASSNPRTLCSRVSEAHLNLNTLQFYRDWEISQLPQWYFSIRAVNGRCRRRRGRLLRDFSRHRPRFSFCANISRERAESIDEINHHL